MYIHNEEHFKQLLPLWQDKIRSITGVNLKQSHCRELIAKIWGFNTYSGMVHAVKSGLVFNSRWCIDNEIEYIDSVDVAELLVDRYRLKISDEDAYTLIGRITLPSIETIYVPGNVEVDGCYMLTDLVGELKEKANLTEYYFQSWFNSINPNRPKEVIKRLGLRRIKDDIITLWFDFSGNQEYFGMPSDKELIELFCEKNPSYKDCDPMKILDSEDYYDFFDQSRDEYLDNLLASDTPERANFIKHHWHDIANYSSDYYLRPTTHIYDFILPKNDKITESLVNAGFSKDAYVLCYAELNPDEIDLDEEYIRERNLSEYLEGRLDLYCHAVVIDRVKKPAYVGCIHTQFIVPILTGISGIADGHPCLSSSLWSFFIEQNSSAALALKKLMPSDINALNESFIDLYENEDGYIHEEFCSQIIVDVISVTDRLGLPEITGLVLNRMFPVVPLPSMLNDIKLEQDIEFSEIEQRRYDVSRSDLFNFMSVIYLVWENSPYKGYHSSVAYGEIHIMTDEATPDLDRYTYNKEAFNAFLKYNDEYSRFRYDSPWMGLKSSQHDPVKFLPFPGSNSEADFSDQITYKQCEDELEYLACFFALRCEGYPVSYSAQKSIISKYRSNLNEGLKEIVDKFSGDTKG